MGRSRGKKPRESETFAQCILTPCIVLSFMTAFGAPKSPTSTSFSGPQGSPSQQDTIGSADPKHVAAPARDSPTPLRTREQRSSSIRPMSMVQTYQPPTMEIAGDTIPELQPIFTFLNSHGNKLYQEGYFLKLNDLDSRASALPFSIGYIANKTSQMGDPTMTDPGPNLSLSLWAQFFRCGTPRHLMSQVKMER